MISGGSKMCVVTIVYMGYCIATYSIYVLLYSYIQYTCVTV